MAEPTDDKLRLILLALAGNGPVEASERAAILWAVEKVDLFHRFTEQIERAPTEADMVGDLERKLGTANLQIETLRRALEAAMDELQAVENADALEVGVEPGNVRERYSVALGLGKHKEKELQGKFDAAVADGARAHADLWKANRNLAAETARADRAEARNRELTETVTNYLATIQCLDFDARNAEAEVARLKALNLNLEALNEDLTQSAILTGEEIPRLREDKARLEKQADLCRKEAFDALQENGVLKFQASLNKAQLDAARGDGAK